MVLLDPSENGFRAIYYNGRDICRKCGAIGPHNIIIEAIRPSRSHRLH